MERSSTSLPEPPPLAIAMRRIYDAGLTTTSGGNISVRRDEGGAWITPAGCDKGTLKPEQIVSVAADGVVAGAQRPSSELPFHRLIYAARPDLHAIVHAHPPGLVAASICRCIPSTRLLPGLHDACGEIRWAPYALTGSAALGRSIADVFAGGADVVLLENHGVVVGGGDLDQALRRFELAEHAAQIAIKAGVLGVVHALSDEQLQRAAGPMADPDSKAPSTADGANHEAREQLDLLARRAHRQRLAPGGSANLSTRGDKGGGGFAFAAPAADWPARPAEEAQASARECEAIRARAGALHAEIYARHPEVGAILTAAPLHVAAFCVTDAPLEARTIPESFILLREVTRLPYEAALDPATVAASVSPRRPALLIENWGAVVLGRTPLEAFDRLEVLESTARSLIEARSLGAVVPLSDAAVAELERAFPYPS